MWKLIDMNNKFGSLNAVVHITSHKMSEANEWIICQSNSVHMSIKSSCQLKLVLCSYVNQIWFLFHSFLIRGHARLRARDYFFLNVLFANANKNKYSQQNHKWTCGCCLLILNYFLPLVSKNSRFLRTLSSLILTWFILFAHGCAGAPACANNT